MVAAPSRFGSTDVCRGNSGTDESTMSHGLPRVSLDRYLMMSCRRPVGTISPTGHRTGRTGEETTVLTDPGNRWMTNVGNIVFTIPPRNPSPKLHPTQEWEGLVTGIHDDGFEARLLDLTAGDPVDREVATIPFDAVGAEDRSLLRVGSIFRWVIGCEKSIDGTRRSVSRIVFLDPPRLTQRDLEKGREWAEWLLEEWGNK